MREIRQIHDQKFQKELRSELFNGNFNSTIRRRAGQKVAENLEQTVKQYSDVQERIAEDMLLLTRNLKEQTETANKIIKKDTEVRHSFENDDHRTLYRNENVSFFFVECKQIIQVNGSKHVFAFYGVNEATREL